MVSVCQVPAEAHCIGRPECGALSGGSGIDRALWWGTMEHLIMMKLDSLLTRGLPHAGVTWKLALQQAVAAAESGADSTKTMAAAAGRSSYVPESVLRDVPDPGAHAVAIWLAAVLNGLQPE